MSLLSRIDLRVVANLTSVLDLVNGSAPLDQRKSIEFTDGSGALQANKVFSDERTLAPSASETLDLNGGALTDALGVVLAFTKIAALIVIASSANANNLTVLGNAAAAPVLNTPATTLTLKPGGVFAIVDPSAAGIVVTPTTFDLIQVANAGAGTSVTYRIIVIGS